MDHLFTKKVKGKINAFLIIVGLSLPASNLLGQSVEISTTAGNINSALSKYTLSEITSLKVNGTLDARDFKIVRDNLKKCTEIDLSGVSGINEYEGYDGTWTNPKLSGGSGSDRDGWYKYPLFELPTQAFSGYHEGRLTGWFPMENIQKVTLPSCITAIGENAFREVWTLQTILIDDNNTYFKSIDGILYSKDGSKLCQYPIGRTDSYTLPASVTTISTDGIRNASFKSLTIQTTTPPALDAASFKATTVYVPDGASAAYKSHDIWKRYNIRELGDITVSKGESDYLNGGYTLQNEEWQGWITYKKSESNAPLYIRFQLNDATWKSAIRMEYSDTYDGEKGVCSFDNEGVCWIPMLGKAEKCLWITATKQGDIAYKMDVYNEQKTKSYLAEEGTFHVVTPIRIEVPTIEAQVGEVTSIPVKFSNTGIFNGKQIVVNILRSSAMTDANATVCYVSGGESETITFDSQSNSGKINITLQDATYNFSLKTTEVIQNCCLSFYLLDTDEYPLPFDREHNTTDITIKESTSEQPTSFVKDHLKYRITGTNTASVIGPDVEDNSTWNVTAFSILPTVPYEGKNYNVTVIEEYAFSGCEKLEQVILPEGLKEIGKDAFYGCGMKTIDIPASVMVIGDAALYTDYLEKINIHKNNTVYASYNGILFNKAMTTLLNCPIMYPEKNIILPEGIITISDNAFEHCELIESVILPEGLEIVESAAFEYCDKLASITIPSTLKKIEDYIFGMDYSEDDICNLSEIHSMHKTPATINMTEKALATVDKNNCKLYVPKGTKSLYEAASIWNSFKNIIEEGSEKPDSISVTGIRLNHTSLILSVGEQADLVATVLPANASNQSFSWETSNPSIVEINSEGIVAKAVGEAIITVKTQEGGFKAICKITVLHANIEPEIPEVTDSSLTIVWEPIPDATDYILNIYKDIEKKILVASYTFDANGQLKSTGFSYILKNLEAASTYYIETTAVKKVGNETVILAQSTTEAKTSGTSSVGNLCVTSNKPQFNITNGQISLQLAEETEVKVYRLSGCCIYADKLCNTASIRLSSGIYILSIGTERHKIIIR